MRIDKIQYSDEEMRPDILMNELKAALIIFFSTLDEKQPFSGADLRSATFGLLNSLGYQSKKTLDLDSTPEANHALIYVF